MVSSRKKRQSNRRLFSQLDDFDRYVIIGNTASDGQENIEVFEGINDQNFTVGTSSNNSANIENVVIVKTLQKCFKERVDREMNK